MSRRILMLALALVAVAAAPAAAHPLGNFSVNHLTVVRVSSDRVDVRYVLDQAEIPTFQERDRTPADVLAAKRAEVARRLTVTVDGRPATLRVDQERLTHPPGQGGLPTTRVELRLSAPADGPKSVAVDDGTFPGRVGWKDVIVAPGDGTRVRSDVPSSDPTGGLRAYPKSLLSTPADQRTAALRVTPGDGSVVAPRRSGGGTQTTTRNRSGDGFAGIFEDAAAGNGVLILLLLAAFGWGALHALSPGHGKAMVAAYLVGSKGTPRQAVLLGLTVTVTHTIGVFALGFVTLALSAYVLPEDLYPWLNLVAGLMVLVVGGLLLRSRLRGEPDHHHHHAHDDAHDHHHHHDHDHGHHHHDHGHGHHHHHPPERLTPRGLLALGASAGLIPCPSALVVLLGAVAQHEVALGMLLIVAFSAGLATTLMGLGLAVVLSGDFLRRVSPGGRLAAFGRVAPTLSSVLIVSVGGVLTLQAVPKLL